MSTENRTRGQKKIYFKHQSSCIGKHGFGTCTDCLEKYPRIALGCTNMGEYMPKREWNRIFKNSPLYTECKPREMIEEMMDPDRPVRFSSNGKRLDKFGLPVGRNGF